jgi:hypothetical protein
MFGADMGGEIDRDKHEAEIDGSPNRRFDAVYDGMGGKYCIAGKIIAKSDPYDGFETAKIDPGLLDIDRHTLAAKVSKAFGRKVTANDFALILFSHFG